MYTCTAGVLRVHRRRGNGTFSSGRGPRCYYCFSTVLWVFFPRFTRCNYYWRRRTVGKRDETLRGRDGTRNVVDPSPSAGQWFPKTKRNRKYCIILGTRSLAYIYILHTYIYIYIYLCTYIFARVREFLFRVSSFAGQHDKSQSIYFLTFSLVPRCAMLPCQNFLENPCT